MPDLTQITGGVVLPDGSVPYEGRIHFVPVGWDCPAAGKVQPPAARTFPLGPSGGLVDVYLSPSTTSLREMPYRVSVTHFNAATRAMETTDLGLISVPEVAEGDSVSIRSLLSDPGVIPAAPDALAQVTAKALEVDADRAAAQAARTAAEAAAAIAQSGTDVSVEGFAELETRLRYSGATGPQLNVVAGMYVRDRSAGAIYRVMSAGAAAADLDYTGSGGVRLAVVGEMACVSSFGYDGTASTTSAAQAALNWLAAAPKRTLVWDRPGSTINAHLNLPNASEWCVHFPLPTRITQVTDNTPIFVMSPTAGRFAFGFSGARVWFLWQNDQPSSNTLAIGVAFNPQTDLPDGIYDFYFDGLHLENGYDLLARHPDAAGFRCPYWGYRIGELHFQSRATGRAIAINSGVAAGAPAGIIDKIYANCINSSANVVDIRTQNGVRINSCEINNARRRAAYFESAQNASIGMLRFENCVLEAGEDLMSVAGTSGVLTVETLELQSIDTAAATDCYGIVAYWGAVVHITGAVTVRDCEATGAGRFRALRAQANLGVYGKFVLPPVVVMQTTNNNVTLYEKSQGAYVSFAAAVTIGPYVLAAVAGVAAGAPMISAYDGSNTYFDIICPADGYIVGVHIRLSAAITAGTLAFRPYINGSAVGGGAFNATITSGQDAAYYGIHKWEPSSVNQGHRVARGDRLRVLVTPTGVTGGGNAVVQLLIAQDVAG